MSTAIQMSDNDDFCVICAVNDGGRELFCGKDALAALGYKNPTNALKQY